MKPHNRSWVLPLCIAVFGLRAALWILVWYAAAAYLAHRTSCSTGTAFVAIGLLRYATYHVWHSYVEEGFSFLYPDRP